MGEEAEPWGIFGVGECPLNEPDWVSTDNVLWPISICDVSCNVPFQGSPSPSSLPAEGIFSWFTTILPTWLQVELHGSLGDV